MDIKPIRNENDYNEALLLLEELVALDPHPDSEDGNKLSILSALVEIYENDHFPEELPSPIEAIRFRMEQSNLKPSDLVKYLGSPSKVSEVLSGKRGLSLEMIRALEAGLGIPAKVLIQKPSDDEEDYSQWDDSLVKEMVKRGYISSAAKDDTKENLLSKFFKGNSALLMPQLAWRKTNPRVSAKTDPRALLAWAEFIQRKADKVISKEKYKDGVVDEAFMHKVIKLSAQSNGPLLAQSLLRDNGIILVVADHLPKTRVDGVTIMRDKSRPVIGMSLRYDRLDNFWFTLMHELAHVSLHLNNSEIVFDELEDGTGNAENANEKQADLLAQEAIIPTEKWEISPAKITPSTMAAESLAKELGINSAIVAGYIRHKKGNYYYLRNVVNGDDVKVRHLFKEQLLEKDI